MIFPAYPKKTYVSLVFLDTEFRIITFLLYRREEVCLLSEEEVRSMEPVAVATLERSPCLAMDVIWLKKMMMIS